MVHAWISPTGKLRQEELLLLGQTKLLRETVSTKRTKHGKDFLQVFFCGTEGWTQDLTHAGEMLFH